MFLVIIVEGKNACRECGICAWSLKVESEATHITFSNNALTKLSPMAIPIYSSTMFLQGKNVNTYEKSKRLMQSVEHYGFRKTPSMELSI